MSFPFDLHSAAVSDSHLPCSDHAVLLKATVQHGRRTAWARNVVCESVLNHLERSLSVQAVTQTMSYILLLMVELALRS